MEYFNHADVAGRIRIIMRKLGLNQSALAGVLEITQPAVSKYLHDRMPPADVLYRLAVLGEVSVEWLLTGVEGSTGKKVAEPLTGFYPDKSTQDQIVRLPGRVQEALRVIIDHLTAGER